MPRAGWSKPVSDRRLSDLVSVGVLMRTFPPALVDEVVAEAGRTEQRNRSLPARVMAYFAIGMALHSEGSYEEVLSLLADGLAWAAESEPLVLPSKSAIFQARVRLGSAPVEALFRRVAEPLAAPGSSGCWLAGRRLVAIDGMCVDVADTPDNDAWFGRERVNTDGRATLPQARVVALAECGTHVMFDAAVGRSTTAENTLALELIDRLQPGMLLLADRGFCEFPLLARAAATGADLLWRAIGNIEARHLETLSDGTWLAEMRPGSNTGRTLAPVTIRVIDDQLDGGRLDDTTHRLFTTMLDPIEAPAVDLAVAAAQQWEIERTFDELKFHQRGAHTVLRSKSPELVIQEIWGHLCCHYAIRTLMWESADQSRIDPDRSTSVAALRTTHRSTSAAADHHSKPDQI